MFCEHCGSPLVAGGEFCHKCGVSAHPSPLIHSHDYFASAPATNTGQDVFGEMLNCLKSASISPSSTLDSTIEKLDPNRAITVGLLLSGVFAFVLARSGVRLSPQHYGQIATNTSADWTLKTILFGIMPAIALFLVLSGIQLLFTKRNRYGDNLLLAGLILFPVAVLLQIASLFRLDQYSNIAFISIFLIWYSLNVLYNGIRNVLRVPEAWAIFLTPAVVLASLFLTGCGYRMIE